MPFATPLLASATSGCRTPDAGQAGLASFWKEGDRFVTAPISGRLTKIVAELTRRCPAATCSP